MAIVGACEPSADKAVDPVWGKQPCAHCAMLVSDPRFAAELTTAQGKRLFFDDVGCMILWREEHAEKLRGAWVHDAAWLDASRAHYAEGEATPMDYGFAPRPDGALDYEDVRARVIARTLRRDDGIR